MPDVNDDNELRATNELRKKQANWVLVFQEPFL
jgi:hypothetical protein